MPARITLVLLGLLLLGAAACSDDDDNDSVTGALPPASDPEYCDDLDAVRDGADSLEDAVVARDRAAAEAAIDDLRTDVTTLRDTVRSGDASNEVNQAVGDLAGALEGLETTLRQVSQGESNPTGVIQELETQLPAIASSLDDLRSEARCD